MGGARPQRTTCACMIAPLLRDLVGRSLRGVIAANISLGAVKKSGCLSRIGWIRLRLVVLPNANPLFMDWGTTRA